MTTIGADNNAGDNLNLQRIFIQFFLSNGDFLHAELRTTKEFLQSYRIVEEDHHFHLENNGKFYRKSKIYREVIYKATGEVVKRELRWDNRSEVMYDYSLIPQDQIR